MTNLPALGPRPPRFQWHCVSVLLVTLVSLFTHPVAVVGGLLLHRLSRQRSFLRGLVWGATLPSLAWYVYHWGGWFFQQPDQPFLQAVPLSPLLAAMVQPFGQLRHFLRPRRHDEQLAEAATRLEGVNERLRQQVRRRGSYLPEARLGELRLGGVLRWDDFRPAAGIGRRGGFLTLDANLLDQHLLITGATGSGKTEAIKRLVYEVALNSDRDLYLVDGKGDEGLAQAVRAICYHTGRGDTPIVRLGSGTRGAVYNGFAGQAEAICNRLVQMVRAPEAEGNATWYADTNRDMLQLVCLAEREGPPRSLAEVRERLRREWLRKAWRDRPQELEIIKRISKDDFESLGRRLRVLARPLGEVIQPEGFALEECKSAIFSIRTQSVSDVAASLMRFLIEDFKDFTTEWRWPAAWKGVLIIDEFFQHENIIELLQLARSAGLGVVIATQDVSALGNEYTQRRIMANTTTQILLRSLYPEKVAELAGTKYQAESSIQTEQSEATGLGSTRVQHAFRVDNNEARALAPGECFLIRGNKAAKLLVTPVPEAEVQELMARLPPERIPELRPATPAAAKKRTKVEL
jgi:hypothetical protein